MIDARPLILAALLTSTALPALAANTPADDLDAYNQKMTQCKSQQATDHPELSSKQRKKTCKARLGPAPKGVVPAKAPAPAL